MTQVLKGYMIDQTKIIIRLISIEEDAKRFLRQALKLIEQVRNENKRFIISKIKIGVGSYN